MKIFVSFIEEFWPGQIEGTWIGRIEHSPLKGESQYREEIGLYSFDRTEVEKLRGKYDFRNLSKKEFAELQKEAKRINDNQAKEAKRRKEEQTDGKE